ncbi:hypothetical protein HU200_016248 [Digitaria exilis]|uniref:Uncharacterized protein n=1 Tax=Digitaria exilis TaxID=1010633 RepID=A0A835KJ62_9POAL|nr:hypothetical protein HU200_016248 [Digitaria exilis]
MADPASQDIDDDVDACDDTAAEEELDDDHHDHLFQILKDAGVEMDMDGELATAIRHELARIKAQGSAKEAAAGVATTAMVKNNAQPRWWLRLAKGVASNATYVLLHCAYSLVGNIAMLCLMDLALKHPRTRR